MPRLRAASLTLVKPSSINTPLFNKAKTLLGVQPQPIPPIYNVDVAVEAIARAVESDVRDVYVGGAGKLLSVAERISPAMLDVYQKYRDGESQKTDWPKPEYAPNYLYSPVEYDGGRHGDFVAQANEMSPYQKVASSGALSWLALGSVLLIATSALRHRAVERRR